MSIETLREQIEKLGFVTKVTGSRITAGEGLEGEGFFQVFTGNSFYVEQREGVLAVRLQCPYPKATPLESFFETEAQVIDFLQPISPEPENNSEAA